MGSGGLPADPSPFFGVSPRTPPHFRGPPRPLPNSRAHFGANSPLFQPREPLPSSPRRDPSPSCAGRGSPATPPQISAARGVLQEPPAQFPSPFWGGITTFSSTQTPLISFFPQNSDSSTTPIFPPIAPRTLRSFFVGWSRAPSPISRTVLGVFQLLFTTPNRSDFHFFLRNSNSPTLPSSLFTLPTR